VPPARRGGFGFWEGFEGGFLLNDPWLHGTRLAEPKHFKGYQEDILVQRAASWIADCGVRSADSGKPFFAVVSMESPHPPYHASTPHVAERKPAEISLRGNVPLGGPVEHQARDELVFTSVHGDMHGSHGLFRKAWPYEESIRVPLLIRREQGAGSNEPKRKDESTVSLVDLPHMAVAWAEGREWHCKHDSALISMPSATEIALQCPVAWHGFRSAEHDPLEMKNLAGDPARAGEIAEYMRLM
jgi:hypothetical protein